MEAEDHEHAPDTGAGYLPGGLLSAETVLVAVMGPTGSGKSSLVKLITQRDDIVIGEGLTSATLECTAYPFKHEGIAYDLIDTPGFNDTYLDDAAVLSGLADYLANTYRAGIKLSAIIYLHDISNTRIEGSALGNLAMFRRLCGADFYPNILLATNHWSKDQAEEDTIRERDLKENNRFWSTMISRGSRTTRLSDERDKCINLLSSLANLAKTPLQIQKELVDRAVRISRTQAGIVARDTGALERLYLARQIIDRLRNDIYLQQDALREQERRHKAAVQAYDAKLQQKDEEYKRAQMEHQATVSRHSAEVAQLRAKIREMGRGNQESAEFG